MQARDASALLLIFLASVGSGSFGIWTHYDSKAGWDSLSDGYSSSGSAGPGRRGFGSGTDFESISFSDCEDHFCVLLGALLWSSLQLVGVNEKVLSECSLNRRFATNNNYVISYMMSFAHPSLCREPFRESGGSSLSIGFSSFLTINKVERKASVQHFTMLLAARAYNRFDTLG